MCYAITIDLDNRVMIELWTGLGSANIMPIIRVLLCHWFYVNIFNASVFARNVLKIVCKFSPWNTTSDIIGSDRKLCLVEDCVIQLQCCLSISVRRFNAGNASMQWHMDYISHLL